MTRVTDLATGAGLNQGYSSAASAIGWAGGVIVGAVLGGILVEVTGYLGCAILMTALLVLIGIVTYRSAATGTVAAAEEDASL